LLYCFFQWVYVVNRASEKDGVELSIGKIGPGGDSSVDAQLLRSGDRIDVLIDRDERDSILNQAHRQFARSTTDLQHAPGTSRKRSLNEISSELSFEFHARSFELVACASALKIYLVRRVSRVHLFCAIDCRESKPGCDRRRRFYRLESCTGIAGALSEFAIDRDRRLSLGRFQESRRLPWRFCCR